MGTEEATPKRRWRPRFSLLTLVLGVLFVGACGGLWWRWEPWVVLRSFPLVCDGYFSAGLTPDGRRFYCQCGSGSFNNPFVQIPGNYRGLWDTSTGQPLFLAKWDPFDGSAPDDAWISTFERFSPGNRSIVVSGEDSNEQIHLGVLDAQTGCRLPLGGKEQHPIRNVDFSADGQQLLYVAYEDKLPLSAGVFDTASRNEVPLMFPAGFDAPAFRYPCGLSPDGTKALVAGCLEDEPWMAVFDASTGRHLVNLRGNVGSADRITVLPDNRHTLLTLDGKCLLYDLETAQNTVLLSVPYAHGAMLSPDGRRVLVGEGGHESAVYDVGTRTRLFPVHGKEGYLGRMRPYWFSPDSQRLVGEQTFGRLAIRDTSKGDVLFEQGSGECVPSPDALQILVWPGGSGVPSPVLLEAGTGRVLWTFKDVERPVALARFAADGRSFVGTYGSEADLWSRRRPEDWWGLAWLPEFWIVYFSGGALLVIAARRLRARKAVKQEAA